MNKTIIININGTVFHIEEDAYDILKTYMTEVKRHFMNSADSLEITTDIENRIAEMFNEILIREGKQVIVEQDVRKVVEQMGSVQDFESAEDDAKNGHQAYFGGQKRRLFRDPDDHLVAGVCSGVANYFDFNPVWVRLLFAVAVAIGGSGFILYIILWIVVPKAVTRADRMAMKGQRLNLQGFKSSFEEEMSGLRNNLSNFGDEARPFVYKTRDFAGDFFGHLGNFLRGTGKVFIKVIAVAILAACFFGIIALIVGIIAALAFGNWGIYHIFPFNISNNEVNVIFLICSVLLVIIPLLAIMLVIIGGVFKSVGINRATASSLLMVWIVALCTVIFYSVKISANFREQASFSQTVSIAPAVDSTYYLKLNDVKFISAEDSVRLSLKDFKGRVILDDDDDNDMDMPDKNIDIYIEKSDIDKPVLIESFSARGHDDEDALSNARATTYQFKQEGNVLKFNRRLEKRADKLWRAQRLRLTLRIPLNYKLVIDDQVDRFVRDISVYDCKNANKQEGASSAKFVMTDSGLQCKIDTLVVPQTAQPTTPVDSTKTTE